MARLLFVLIAVAVTFMVYSLVDTILRPARFIRALPKWAWVLVVILIPILGGVLWFLIGRGRRSNAPMNRMTAPDDDPEFLRGLNGSGGSGANSGRSGFTAPSAASTDENIRDLEKRFADLDFDDSADPASGATDPTESGSDSNAPGFGKPGYGKAASGDDDSTGRTDHKPGPAA